MTEEERRQRLKRLVEEEIVEFLKKNRKVIIKRAKEKFQREIGQHLDANATPLPELS